MTIRQALEYLLKIGERQHGDDYPSDDGWEKARKALKDGDWISVKDQMPPDGVMDLGFAVDSVEVLCVSGSRIYHACFQRRVDEEETHLSQWFIVGRDRYELLNVTHWMPLPELPKA